jgi:hypothetical protein
MDEPPATPDPRRVPGVARTWRERRRERIIAEIQRNRRGEYTVPTWILTATLVLVVAGWLAVILFVR